MVLTGGTTGGGLVASLCDIAMSMGFKNWWMDGSFKPVSVLVESMGGKLKLSTSMGGILRLVVSMGCRLNSLGDIAALRGDIRLALSVGEERGGVSRGLGLPGNGLCSVEGVLLCDGIGCLELGEVFTKGKKVPMYCVLCCVSAACCFRGVCCFWSRCCSLRCCLALACSCSCLIGRCAICDGADCEVI